MASPKLCEDYHMMMRCLYNHLPSPGVSNRSARDVCRFVQLFSSQFGAFVARSNYLITLDGELRLPQDNGFFALYTWLSFKMADEKPFGWTGYSLTEDQILEVSINASNDWGQVW